MSINKLYIFIFYMCIIRIIFMYIWGFSTFLIFMYVLFGTY